MNKNLKENKNHGDFYLPFTTYKIEAIDNLCFIPLHWHEEMEIALIENGETEINVDLNNFIASKGDICFVKPLSLHSFKKPDGKISIWESMVFNLSMLQSALTDGCLIKYIAPIINNENELPLIIKKDSIGYDEIKKVLQLLFQCYREKYDGYELEIKSLLFHLFSLLYKYSLVEKSSYKITITSDASNKIKNVLHYISNNYANPISISELAEICNFSEFHFMKFFKKHTSLTAVEYINNYRITEASNLLLNTDKSIMDISLEVGFNSVSYFNKLFKQTYNLTPKELRNKFEHTDR